MKAVFLDCDTLGPTDIDLSPLSRELPGLECFPHTDPEHLRERITDAEAIIVNKVTLDDSALRIAGRLRLVCLAATGTDNVALKTAQELGIAVCNIRDYCTPSVVQHVFALILSLTDRLHEYRDLLRQGTWSERSEFCLLDYPFRELRGKTMGIVGLGSLGTGVAGVARAFGMRVIATIRKPTRETAANTPDDDTTDIERVDLDELLAQSDIVSLHCPLNAETENLIDAGALKRMRPGAILINTARGGLVDSAALINALKNKDISGAGIDVLRREPPDGAEPIIDVELPNLIVTPHIAWAASEARQRAVEEIAGNIASFKKSGKRNRVV